MKRNEVFWMKQKFGLLLAGVMVMSVMGAAAVSGRNDGSGTVEEQTCEVIAVCHTDAGQMKYDEMGTQPQTSPYSVNEFGQTYGSASLAASYDERPELISAVGRDGTKGYVYFTDLKADHPKTPEEALAQQESYYERMAAWDGKEILVVRTIPLYAVDGQTVMGEYDISFTPNGDNW